MNFFYSGRPNQPSYPTPPEGDHNLKAGLSAYFSRDMAYAERSTSGDGTILTVLIKNSDLAGLNRFDYGPEVTDNWSLVSIFQCLLAASYFAYQYQSHTQAN